MRLVEVKQDDDEPPTTLVPDSDDSEPDPVSSDETESAEDDVKWEAEWEKWYFSNKDRIPFLASGLREWFEDKVVQHFYEEDKDALNKYLGKENATESKTPSNKRKARNTATTSGGKKGKKERENDLVNELVLLFRFLKQTHCDDPAQCCLLYNDLLVETYNKYKKENEEEIEDFIFDVYKKCDPYSIKKLWEACKKDIKFVVKK